MLLTNMVGAMVSENAAEYAPKSASVYELRGNRRPAEPIYGVQYLPFAAAQSVVFRVLAHRFRSLIAFRLSTHAKILAWDFEHVNTYAKILAWVAQNFAQKAAYT